MPGKSIEIIAAMDHKSGIGKDNGIPWYIPADLKRFKEITTRVKDPGNQNAVILGRKTWESLPERYRPLSGRFNVVLSKSAFADTSDNLFPGAHSVGGFSAAIQLCEHHPLIEKIFVIGGAEVYRAAMRIADKVHLTLVSGDFNCDVFFPDIPDNFNTQDISEQMHHDDLYFTYVTFYR